MKQALIVGLGGLVGLLTRYKIGGIILHHSGSWRLPLSTFVVNVAGCFVIGALAALVEHRDYFSPDARLFLFTGLLGGFSPSRPSATKEFFSFGAAKSQSR